jgi:hypothetical protein
LSRDIRGRVFPGMHEDVPLEFSPAEQRWKGLLSCIFHSTTRKETHLETLRGKMFKKRPKRGGSLYKTSLMIKKLLELEPLAAMGDQMADEPDFEYALQLVSGEGSLDKAAFQALKGAMSKGERWEFRRTNSQRMDGPIY